MNTLPSNPRDSHGTGIARARRTFRRRCFGETCFRTHNWEAIQEDPRRTISGPWPWTDDTAMGAEHSRRTQRTRRHRPGLARAAVRVALQGAQLARLRCRRTDCWSKWAMGFRGETWRKPCFPAAHSAMAAPCEIAPLAGYFADEEYTEMRIKRGSRRA